MKTLGKVGLKDVQAVYGGAEGDLWELIMGEQVHIGGMTSSLDLLGASGITPGMSGIDLCCCNGAGMRFLCRFAEAKAMTGVDATETVVQRGIARCAQQGLADRIRFVSADVCATGLPAGQADFVWGEDAWCYVADKPALIAEAARLVKPGGIIAFTDWVEGKGLTAAEAERYMAFMKFPTILTLEEYSRLLKKVGCDVSVARDTGRFAPYTALYIDMLTKQLTYDALRIIGFDMNLMQAMGGELTFVRELAEAGKIAQGLVMARKR